MPATATEKKTRRTTLQQIADLTAKKIASLETRIEKAKEKHVAPLELELRDLRAMQTHVGGSAKEDEAF